MDMSIGMAVPSGAVCTLSLSFNNDGPLGTFFRYICDNGTYIARYDDLVDGRQEPIDVSGVDVSMDGIELGRPRVLRRHPGGPGAERERGAVPGSDADAGPVGEEPGPGVVTWLRMSALMTETEADTCRKFVVPMLREAGWDDAPHAIDEQRTFTDGRIVFDGGKARRGRQKRADYILRYRSHFPIAVVEAKPPTPPGSRRPDFGSATASSRIAGRSDNGAVREA